MYDSYRPLRNYLRGFNLWSGLSAVYSYLQYLQFGRPLPAPLTTQATRLGQGPVRARLFPHVIEIMARELILNGQHRGGKPFGTAQVCFRTMRSIRELEDVAWKHNPARSDDILLQLSRIAFMQIPWQSPITNAVLARHHALYADRVVAPMVESRFGITVDELFQLIMLLAEELIRRPTLALEFLRTADPTVHAPVAELMAHLSKPLPSMRTMMEDGRRFDVDWAYTFDPLREFPLVHPGNPKSIMCPAPPLLLRRLTDGLYFDLMRSDRAFGNAIGASFEAHVGTVAARIGREALTLLPEAIWGSPERRSVDWIVSDGTAAMFVECKLARLDIASQTEISPEPAFVRAIGKLAGHIGQLYSTLADGLAQRYPHWKPDGRPIHPVVVTFHEWFAFGPFFYRHLDRLVGTEFARRGLDPVLLDRHPYSICSLDEFEGLLVAVRDNGIDAVLSGKNVEETREWLMRGFLSDRYPGSVGEAARTFDDGMDPVIEAPSRLTRRSRANSSRT